MLETVVLTRACTDPLSFIATGGEHLPFRWWKTIARYNSQRPSHLAV